MKATQICVSEDASMKSEHGNKNSDSLKPARVKTPSQISSPVIFGNEIESPMFNIQLRDFKDVKITRNDGKKISKFFSV